MRIWLDDVLEMPSDFDYWAKDYFDALSKVVNKDVTYISFDHDLGDEYRTGYNLASAIEKLAYYKLIPPMGWNIHSANPVGRKNIEQAMKSAERF